MKKLLILVAATVLALPACHWRKSGDCEECGVKKECKKRECRSGCARGACSTGGCRKGACGVDRHEADEKSY